MSYVLFAKWFGVISTLLALGILFNLDDAKAMAKDLVRTEAGYILSGVLPIIFGSLCFLQHNEFDVSNRQQLVVTVLGLFMLLAGAYRVLFVRHWKKTISRHIDYAPALFSLFGLMLGLLMLYVGYIAPIVR